PGAPRGFAAELVHFAEGLEENVVGGVLGPGRVAQQPERQVINRPAMLLVKFRELGVRQGNIRRIRTLEFCQRLAHGGYHWGLDRNRARMSRSLALPKR